MPKMISFGSEMIHINPAKNVIEYSTNNGRSWVTRYTGSSCGTFMDLLPYGNEILAVTNRGIYYSTNSGRSWVLRYSGSSCGEFQTLVDSGKVVRGYEVRIKRNGEEVGHGKIAGLKRFKDDVKEVEKGYECGILIEGFKGVAEGDVIECFKKENVTRRIKM